MDRSTSQRPEFWRVAQRTCIIAAAVDIAFFGIFLALKSPILAWVNVISVMMYAVAYYAYGKRMNGLATSLVWTEVVAHAALGTVLIGWGSGFHYYLLMFIPALAVTMRGKTAVTALMILFALYAGLYLQSYWHEPLQPISANALLGVFFFNLSVVFAMFSYLGFFYAKSISSANRKLNRLASVDELTQLYNRRQAKALAETELSRADRNSLPLSAMLLDIDHFKLINDVYGHDKGDQVLQYIAKIMQRELRQHDIIGRWGGEEFMIVLPETDLAHAEYIGERLRNAIGSHAWGTDLGHEIQITASIGISQHKQNETFNRLLKRADTALYMSKSEGRNRVTAIQEIPKHIANTSLER
ncbi:GGDEF domain-containing protein [Pseudidiomarina homiensis]|uniref:diguanylate cyclase n=1 Tax=Pseudidiomarina homiensis TaxID=364198 RepID=A0A432XXT4_9GAMM|nr:GGDEF domain-containing protein [Pseudidiomarina homiensis]RUO53526.1 GGDEF domain-containing protein [Pseudidiomarina homiensis]